jgi:hypothetical protein
MARFNSPLKNVTVATPCPADWDGMLGGDRVRFCGQCELNVYNLSAMSRLEAESLIARTEGRLCVRFYRRKDGSVITQDCPVGLRALKRRASRIKRAVAASVLGFFAGLGFNAAAVRLQDLAVNVSPPWERHTVGVMVPQRKAPVPNEPEPGNDSKQRQSTKSHEPTRNKDGRSSHLM